MKRFAWTIITACLMAVGLGSGCLITDGSSTAGECCYQYETCETYCDPYGNCEDECWFQESCPTTCDSGGTTNNGDNNQGGDFCYSDAECSGDDICVGNSCERPDTAERGTAGICQACETKSDCVDPNALCVQLRNDDSGPAERVCTAPCGSDSDCPSGFECSNIGGSTQCLPEPNANNVRTCESAPDLECVTARDCAAGESCVNNECEAPDTAECGADADCGSGEVCDRQECVPEGTENECTTRSDCASGQVCTNGTCEGGTESCVFNNECSEEGLCVNGNCFSACSQDDDCGNLEHCRQGICRTTECNGTSDCAGDEMCIDATCMPACESSGDCDSGYVCTEHGYCDRDPNVECRSGAECSRDEVCYKETCRAACTCNQDCSTGEICDMESNTCVDDGGEPPTTCEDTCDCPSGLQCNDSGQCE
jgi:hypothetical protein